METLYDVNKKKRKKEALRLEFERKTGKTKLPQYLITPLILVVKRITPEELLMKGGYRRENKGYSRRFEKDFRYHAYILDHERIEIHTDQLKITKNSKKLIHVPSTYKVKTEKVRLKALFPPEPGVTKPMTIVLDKTKKNSLTNEELKVAMEALKKTRERPWWKKLFRIK